MASGGSSLATALTLAVLLTTGYAFKLELTPSGDVWSRIGETLVLRCRVDNCPSPSFKWNTGTDTLLGGTVSSQGSESTLTFAPVTVQNQHKYGCSAKCGTKEKARNANLNIYSLPDALTLDTVGSLEVGRKGTVRCTVPDVYPARLRVEWLKGSALLETDTFSKYTEKETSVSFTYELTPELQESGQELTCRIHLLTEKQLKAEGTLTLQIHYAPRILSISVQPSVSVREGQDARLTCAVDSSPAASIKWSKLTADGWSPTAEDKATLHLSPALVADSGIYRCEASNKLGGNATEVEFNVQGAPRHTTLSITPSAVKEGDRVTVSCTTHSNPTAQLVLRRMSSNGWMELHSENGTFTIRAVQLDDEGQYQCEAISPLGKDTSMMELTILGAPRHTTLSITPSVVKEGDRVTVSCTTHSNPTAQLVLRRMSSNGWMELHSENGTFTIHAVQLDDEGQYQCEAINPLGRQLKSTELIVQVLTVWAHPSKWVNEGENVTIGCTVRDISSANFTWKKLENNSEAILSFTNYTFTILAITPSDAGFYEVEVINKFGNQIGFVEIKVIEKKLDESPVGVLVTACTGAAVGSVGLLFSALYYVYRKISFKKSYQIAEEIL